MKLNNGACAHFTVLLSEMKLEVKNKLIIDRESLKNNQEMQVVTLKSEKTI